MSYRKIAAGRIGIGPIVEQNGSQVEAGGVGWAGTGECRAAIADHGGDVVITKQIEGLPAGVDVGLVAPRRGDVAVAELRENVAAVGAGRVDHRGEVAVAVLKSPCSAKAWLPAPEAEATSPMRDVPGASPLPANGSLPPLAKAASR